MTSSRLLSNTYDVCVIDIGSPKLGNLGWCFQSCEQTSDVCGTHLDDLIPHIATHASTRGLLLGLEAPLYVPLRDNLLHATKARAGEGRRPWSAGAGAQVLAMNLPIMIYLFQQLKHSCPQMHYCVHESQFDAQPQQILIFEALVSGSDKGTSHINDAQIMVASCLPYAQRRLLPASILQHEPETQYFNLTSAALLRCGLIDDVAMLQHASPIYKPISYDPNTDQDR